MAIEKTYIYNSTDPITPVYEYLLNNAVPDYFSGVQMVSDEISCLVDGREFLRIKKYISGTELAVSIEIKGNGCSKTIINPHAYIGYNIYNAFQYGYKCAHGIALNNPGFAWGFLITKDSSGETIVVTTADTTLRTTGNANAVYAVSPQSRNISGTSHYCTELSQLTCLCPLPVSDTNTYAQDVFLMPFRQYNFECTFFMNGYRYLSNGLLCVRDE